MGRSSETGTATLASFIDLLKFARVKISKPNAPTTGATKANENINAVTGSLG
jgi:hypothetical protein